MPRATRLIDRCPMCEVKLTIGPSRKSAICPRCNTSFDGDWQVMPPPRQRTTASQTASHHPVWFMRAEGTHGKVLRFVACLLIAVVAVVFVHLLFRPSMRALDEAKVEAEKAALEAEQIHADMQELLRQMQQR